MLRSELDARAGECEHLQKKAAESSSRAFEESQKLQSELTEERGRSAQAKAEAGAAGRELSMLKTELEMRTKEIERLQVRVAESSRTANDELQRVQGQLAAQQRQA